MTRTWPVVGRRYNATDEGQRRILAAVELMTWNPLPVRLGAAVVHAIEAWNAATPGEPLAVAISWEFMPFGLYGIETRYANGRARNYVVDEGHQLVAVLSDFWQE